MPIKKENKDKYPADWKAIRRAVLERAENACECTGECGLEYHQGLRCAAPNGVTIWWIEDIGYKGRWVDADGFASAPFDEFREKPVKIVLTTAHLDHELVDHSLDNLKALCQRCHNLFDLPYRRANAAKTRLKSKIEALKMHDEATGQGRLFS